MPHGPSAGATPAPRRARSAAAASRCSAAAAGFIVFPRYGSHQSRRPPESCAHPPAFTTPDDPDTLAGSPAARFPLPAPSYVHGTSDVPLLGETIGENLRRTVE